MNIWIRAAFVSAAIGVTPMLAGIARGADDARAAANAPAAKPADVPIKLVVLFNSGVGYFEHFGSVAGDNRTELRFKTAQINDVLKSLVLQDLDGGHVSTITYPSHDPLEKTLRSFQVDITANPSLAELLNQLRGAKLTIQQAAEKTTGTVLGVERQKKPVGDKQVIEEPVLNLLVDGKIVAILLSTVSGIEFDDATLRDELAQALAALNQARDQDKKPVSIRFEGKGDRRVRVGYVVETPVWKTSYRLILGREDKPKLQGWAIVENQTDNDWNDVQLSLVSGRPISFIQDLYQPLYVARPVVQPEIYTGLSPQRYGRGIIAGKEAPMVFNAGTPPAAAPAPARAPGRGGFALKDGVANDESEMSRSLNATASVASIASAAKVGELFQYTVGNVSLPRQKSAMIPIITDDVEVEKLSIYNQSVLPKNPLNGARLKNTTGKHLLAGPITVFDGASYAGDAQIETLPPGQERLISYGIDQEVLVDATKNTNESSLVTGRIIKGVLELQRKQVFSQDYLADNKSDHDKTLIIEHPLRPGWKLLEPAKPIDTTEQVYRFRGALPSGKTSKLTVKQEIVQAEALGILPWDIEQLAFYSKAGEIPEDVRKALTQAIDLRRKLAGTERQIDQRKKKIGELTEQQKHTSEIMKALQQNTPLYTRLVGKLSDLQTEIEKNQAEIEDLNKTLEQQRNEMETYIANLNVG